MGRGARPAKAKSLLLVPGLVPGVVEPDPAAGAVAIAEPDQQAQPVAIAVAEVQPQEAVPLVPESSTPLQEVPAQEAEPEPEAVPTTLEELRELKERIRLQHPDWYPEFRDTFGHQFNVKLLPHVVELTAAELGLPPGTDSDRVRRELRALAFARSYQMAEAGDIEGLRQLSPDLLYYWDDRLGGKLLPAPPIPGDHPAPWVRSINRLRSQSTGRLDAQFGSQTRFRRFVNAVKGWTDGRWKQLREASKRVLRGKDTSGDAADREARELIEAIRGADRDAPRLWRKERAGDVAERMGVSPGQLFSHLQARLGDEVAQDLVSASARSDIWHGDFLWEVEPGAQAIHAYPISHHPSEREWITAGTFRLLEVARLGSAGVKVRVEQTGVFKKEE